MKKRFNLNRPRGSGDLDKFAQLLREEFLQERMELAKAA